MIVDTIGLLSAIYRYGHIAWIGGGFGKGIHNTLEAATYGIPVVFGPRYHKFKEARDLIDWGGGFSLDNYEDFFSLIEKFREEESQRKESGTAAGSYVQSMCGATRLIMEEVFAVSGGLIFPICGLKKILKIIEIFVLENFCQHGCVLSVKKSIFKSFVLENFHGC
jgi:3-deoxy-D-manno-octulosonic-acid transferase